MLWEINHTATLALDSVLTSLSRKSSDFRSSMFCSFALIPISLSEFRSCPGLSQCSIEHIPDSRVPKHHRLWQFLDHHCLLAVPDLTSPSSIRCLVLSSSTPFVIALGSWLPASTHNQCAVDNMSDGSSPNLRLRSLTKLIVQNVSRKTN
jgi:hypothetical protein